MTTTRLLRPGSFERKYWPSTRFSGWPLRPLERNESRTISCVRVSSNGSESSTAVRSNDSNGTAAVRRLVPEARRGLGIAMDVQRAARAREREHGREQLWQRARRTSAPCYS